MGNEKQKGAASNSKAPKVKGEETDSDDDFKPKLKRSAAMSNAKASKVKNVKDKDLDDDIKVEKKRMKKVGVTEGEKKVAGKKDKVNKEKRVYELPGQKHDTPAERDPLRIFYESLYEQVPSSEMAAIWMMEWGLLPLDVARKVFEKKQGQKVKSPIKQPQQRDTVSPAKKTPMLSAKKTSSAVKDAETGTTQRKRRASKDSDDDEDLTVPKMKKVKWQKISS